MKKEEREVWLVTVNEDLTEGRGSQYPKYVCELKETAIRLSKGQDVQGTDGRVMKFSSPKINGKFLAPYRLVKPSLDDKAQRKENLKIEEKRKHLDKIRIKAKELGLTDQEISDLSDA